MFVVILLDLFYLCFFFCVVFCLVFYVCLFDYFIAFYFFDFPIFAFIVCLFFCLLACLFIFRLLGPISQLNRLLTESVLRVYGM